MSTDRETTRVVRSWLAEGVTRLPDRVLDAVLDQVPATPQRRRFWSAWRPNQMNNYAKLATAAGAVLVVSVVGYNLLPGLGGSSTGATTAPSVQPSRSPSPTEAPNATPQAVTVRPFAPPEGFGMCPEDAGAACVEDPQDDSISISYLLPVGWERHDSFGAFVDVGVGSNVGVSVLFTRGNWMFTDPCRPVNDEAGGDIPVGPTVEDFVTALGEHPELDVTTPVDVTLAGYSGLYLDLQIPADLGTCDTYRPIDEHIYAQGPGQRWHMWVLDVDSVRVLIETTDYAATPEAQRAQAQAMLDSLVITP